MTNRRSMILGSLAFLTFRGSVRAVDSSSYCLLPEEQQLLALFNGYRSDNGVPPVTPGAHIGAAARHHAVDISSCRKWDGSHALCDGTTFSANIANHGYTQSGGFIGEVMAAGQALYSPLEAFNGFLSSPPHAELMRSSLCVAVGVGFAFRRGSKHDYYWVIDFGGALDPEAAVACP